MKRIIAAAVCAAVLICALCAFPSAQEPYYTGSFSLINMNVQGLTTLMGSDCYSNSAYAGKILSEYDIAAVQEDFNFHPWLTKNLTLDNRTFHSGITGAGDGMNVFSRYKIYNQTRIAWNKLSGVFDGGNDELTPKGILYCVIELAEGVYIDLYDIHADAYGDEGSVAARKDNYIQLEKLVREKSANRAYIITGDFNDPLSMNGDLYTCLMQPLGCSDAWCEIVNSGVVPETTEGYQWGRYNSVERVFYKSSEAVQLTAQSHEYFAVLNPENGEYCSDHSAQTVTMSVSASQREEGFKPDWFNPFSCVFTQFKNVAATIYKIISSAIALYIPRYL